RYLRERGDGAVLSPFRRQRLVERRPHEPDGIAGPKLADFPEFRLDDGGRADESAQARAVLGKDHWHIAGEIDRANGVFGVVDVGRMQSGVPAVRAREFRFGSDKPYAGAAGVVMDLPVR